jgi:hypothetical protein
MVALLCCEIRAAEPLVDWSRNLAARRNAVNQADRRAWQAVQAKEDWEKFKAPRIEGLRGSLGQWPAPLKNPVIAITKSIEGDGFRIDNLVYETRPGFFVTANLYSPVKPGKKMPCILICTSHHNPKSQGELQDMGMTWARLGCLVLVPDQLGHGERRNHPFTDARSYPGPFKIGRQDYYFRYNEALQLHLIGESLMGWMVWDLMRGVDVLLSKDGIDKEAIILLGSVAGGGDPAAVTAALDPRITAVAPFNFGGPQPETKFPLPADAETSFNYLGGGSWESTRNLRLSGQGDFLPWVIVGSVAPRGLIYGHEFAWDKDRDPVWARLQKIYGFYGAADKLSSAHGRGAVTGQPPESTHCNNIGPEHRKHIYPALAKWFGMAEPDKEYQKRLVADELLCWSGEAKKTYQPRSLTEVVAEVGRQRTEASRGRHADLTPAEARTRLRQDWARLLGHVEPTKDPFKEPAVAKPFYVQRASRRDGLGWFHLVPPNDAQQGRKFPVVVVFSQQGRKAEANPAEQPRYKAIRDSGIGLCFAHLRGLDHTDSRGRTSTSTALSATELMLGETVIGQQLRELRELLALLRTREDVDAKRIALLGDSLAEPNPPERLVQVPLDAGDTPNLAEPGCCLLALLCALFEEDMRAICGRRGLVGYQSVLASPFVHVPHDAIVPGALTTGDWADLAAALAPRSLRLEGLVDGLNRRVSQKELEAVYSPTRLSYQNTRSTERLVLDAEISSPEGLARWLVGALKVKE